MQLDFDEHTLEHLGNQVKSEIRKRMSAVRQALPSEVRKNRSAEIAQRLIQLPHFANAHTIAAFIPLRGELDPNPIVEAARASNKKVTLPRVHEESELSFHYYNAGDPLHPSACGVHEPLPESPEATPEEIDLVLVPGLAFDERGYRIGHGRGFYDRFLPRVPRATKIGVAYDFQLVAEVPRARWDQPVDYVVTDKRVIVAAP